MKKILLLIFVVCLIFAKPNITSRLNYYLKKYKPEQKLAVIVYLKDQVDLDKLEEEFRLFNVDAKTRAYRTITALQEKAKLSEEFINNELKNIIPNSDEISQLQRFWIFNGFMIETKVKYISKLAEKNEIETLDIDAPVFRDDPNIGSNFTENYGEAGVADNLKVVKAHKLWQIGITGKGRLVLGLDTGVDGTHPALNYKWRGKKVPVNQAWFDPANSTSPTDCDQHGTHTMGTMVGLGKTTNDTVGIAIDAEWIGGKVICGSGSVTSTIISAFQWAMNPDGNANTTSDMPDAINCSWYDPDVTNECTSVYVQTLTAVETAGIAVVFSAGNSGPNPSTITKPKNINKTETNTFCVAAIDYTKYLQGNNDPIASFSSRGPSVCGGTGALLIKPEVSAPGVNIKSTVPGGGYAQTNWSGTSMASPHVAGAVALLKEAFPDLPGYMIKEALYYTAIDLGATGEDNNYGRGLIDIWAAYEYLQQFTDKIPPEKITTIKVADSLSNSAIIQFNTPKDNKGVVGFDIRISENPIDTTNLISATIVKFNSTPDTIKLNKIEIKNLKQNTKYYVAIRAFDKAKNYSKLATIQFTTLDKPIIELDKDTLKLVYYNKFKPIKDSLKIVNNSTKKSTLEYKIYTQNKAISYDQIISYIEPNRNLSEGNLSFYGSGGPDKFGYFWVDNNTSKKLKFNWNDIKATGKKIEVWSDVGTTIGSSDDGQYGPIDLGFNFKFYDSTYNKIYINTNGLISFLPFEKAYGKNVMIPNTAKPNCIIAPLWDELDGKDLGNVYYQVDNDKITIQYDNWSRYSLDDPGKFTFQVILNKNNEIYFLYKNIEGRSNDCTIGIENPTGTDGLLVAYNSKYLKDSLIIQFKKLPVWYKSDTLSGILYNKNALTYYFQIVDTTLEYGQYLADIVILSNDIDKPELKIPVVFKFSKLIVDNEPTKVKNYQLYQNYPNPFNPVTVIKYDIPKVSFVTLKVYDILGREVATLVERELVPGSYSTVFDASMLSSGTYIYKLSAGDFTKTFKMMLVK